MKNSVLAIFFFFAVGTMLSIAQTVTLTTYGVAPYDVTIDSVEHYFDRPYNGLKNVGINSKVYLLGKSTVALSNPVWTLTEKPSGSNAAFGATKDVDTSNQLITFIPDIQGTYKITFTSGTKTSEIILNGALYYGVEGGPASCKTCHNNILFDYVYDKWAGTNHAATTQKGVDGILSSHFNQSCLKCHSTGYDTEAANDGFDDFPFVFPTTLVPGNYTTLLGLYPDAMKRANVQCEACHGPGSNHLSQIDNSKIDVTLNSDVCAYCHKEGSHHNIPLQWDESVHASGSNIFSGSSRYACTPCHNGQGFLDFVKGNAQSVQVNIPITCATCHDPHDATNLHQVRIVTATLKNGVQVDNAGLGGLCINCHHSRNNAVPFVENYLASLNNRYGPHHGPQGDMLIGTNAYTWGETLDQSPHFAAVENACVGCHMAQDNTPLNPETSVGGHTFSMVNGLGQDNVAACADCHGNFGPNFSDKKLYVNGSADLDKNGVAEGLQIEIEGLLHQLAMLLPPVGSPNINVIDSTWTLDQAGALYNYVQIEEDRSMGIHNPRFTVGLLYLSIGKLGGIVSVDDLKSDVPSDYSLSNNYPNPFNPTTTINFSIPEQANVKVIIYDALGNQVDVIADEVKSAGTYSVKWNATNYASGIYFYRLEANNFVQVRKMILMK
ncbi:MAG: T9SS type A sorting domain-containing protein [Ignavibacterium sp.]|nr:T9SS type A sorting domain-containing protein [Ignavibacterium sp.]